MDFATEYPAMRVAALRMLGSTAQDIPSDERLDLADVIMERAWRHWPGLADAPAPMRYGWLKFVVHNAVFDWRKRQHRHPTTDLDAVAFSLAAPEPDDVFSDWRERLAVLLPKVSPTSAYEVGQIMAGCSQPGRADPKRQLQLYAAVRRLRQLAGRQRSA